MALEMIRNQPGDFDIVISDVTMPILGGIELTKIIKSQYPEIKVIILTMHNSLQFIREAVEVEADGYLLKNTGREDFIYALNRVANDGSYFSPEVFSAIKNFLRNEKNSATSSKLSPRETEVLRLIVQEYTSKEIADKLFISKQTVDTHRMNIMQKTGSKSLVGLIKFAIHSGLS
jgi:DNA-binding NarL/FixJ family response regulator